MMSRKNKKEKQTEKAEDQEKQQEDMIDNEATEESGFSQDKEGKDAEEDQEKVMSFGDSELVEDEPGEEVEDQADPETAEINWEKEKEELLDQIKRKQAEMDNLRRISKMEQKETREYGLHQFLCKLLPILDNLERGLEQARADKDVPESYVNGLEMIYKQLFQVLEQEGVRVMEAAGTSFDPHCHHAVMEVESEEEPGNVVEELQKGYWHYERVLRPAMVKVCRE